MEPTTTSQPTAEPTRTDTTNTFKTPDAPADRHFKQMIVPGLGGPDFLIPASVSKFFRKLFRRKATPAA
jgi:putative intracellular protease/amidase